MKMNIDRSTCNKTELQGSFGTRDALIAMPVRRPSLSSIVPRSLTIWSHYGSSDCCPYIDGRDEKVLLGESIPSSSSEDHFTATRPYLVDEIDTPKKCVRFSPERSRSITIIMCLGDYTTTEHEACWYSRQELDEMLHRDTRWNAGATLDHMYDKRTWSKISSRRSKLVSIQKTGGIRELGNDQFGSVQNTVHYSFTPQHYE